MSEKKKYKRIKQNTLFIVLLLKICPFYQTPLKNPSFSSKKKTPKTLSTLKPLSSSQVLPWRRPSPTKVIIYSHGVIQFSIALNKKANFRQQQDLFASRQRGRKSHRKQKKPSPTRGVVSFVQLYAKGSCQEPLGWINA